MAAVSNALKRSLDTRPAVGIWGAQSIQSERSVPPIPVVCQCKSLDDQGSWPVLPTRIAVRSEAREEADAEFRFAT